MKGPWKDIEFKMADISSGGQDQQDCSLAIKGILVKFTDLMALRQKIDCGEKEGLS